MSIAPLFPSNPLPGFNFGVAFGETEQPACAIAGGGITALIAGFQEITGLEASIDIHEYKEGGLNDHAWKFATAANFGNITFKRGVVLSPDLWQWFLKVRQGSFGARRQIAIFHMDSARTPALTWMINRALPAKYSGPAWNSGQSSVAIESLEVAHEGLTLLPGLDLGVGGALPAGI